MVWCMYLKIVFSLVSSGWALNGNRLGRSGGTSDGKIPEGDTRGWLGSMIVTVYGIWLGEIIGWTVDKVKGYLMRALVCNIFYDRW